MKVIFKYFNDFHKDYFSLKLYLAVALFISALISFNYYLNFENGYIDVYRGKPIRAVWYFIYHSFAYLGVIALIQLYGKQKCNLNWTFWLKVLLAFTIIGFDRSSTFLVDFVWRTFPDAIRLWYFKTADNFFSAISILLPLVLVKFWLDRRSVQGIYGLTFRNVNLRPYWVMGLIMLPIIYCASLTDGFQAYYPVYKRAGGEAFALYYGFSEKISVLFFEIFYLGSFLNTELFFRGFLIIGFAQVLGKNAVLPMAATYAVLHFGKPIGETISSVFGGYILGIVALYSRNIWGGVCIHAGIAFLMELFAFVALNGVIAYVSY